MCRANRACRSAPPPGRETARSRTHKAAAHACADRPRSSPPASIAAIGPPRRLVQRLAESAGNSRHRPHPHARENRTARRSARISSSGSTAPIAVVPSVTTTVPTSPLRSSSSSASRSHPPAVVGGNRCVIELQHGGDALVGVVRLLRPHNPLPRRQLPGHPKRFEVGDRAARGQVAQIELSAPAEHRGDLATASISIAELARPPSRAWLLGLIAMASA